MGTLAILNVGAGDLKVSFDRNNPAELIRAKRIIKDMLRRGYALLVEVERNGEKAFERAIDFNEDHCEYIIADFDPEIALNSDRQDAYETELNRQEKPTTHGQSQQNETGVPDVRPEDAPREEPKPGRGRPRRGIPADKANAVGVARSAGG